MKFIHLADLHIGKSLNGFSMLGEQERAFKQIIGYIRDERPEAVVIAGDVYDRIVPGVEAVSLFDDFLTSLAGEGLAVLLISGNHDSPERLGFASRLLEDRKLFMCTAGDNVRKVSFQDEYGEINFWLLPFARPATARGSFGGFDGDSYDDMLAAALAASGIDYDARNVLVSHQFFTAAGVEPVRSESEMNYAGGLDAIDAELIGKFDYAALGHLHGAQEAGAGHIRYAGSPVKYSFSEWQQEKSVSLVEIGKKGELSVTALPLTPLHDMREIRGKIDELMSDGISSLADKNDYLRVILTDEEEIIDPMGKLRSVYPNIMGLGFENSRTMIDIGAISTDTMNIERLSPYDLFCEFFLDVQGSAMSPEQEEIVRRLLTPEGQAEIVASEDLA